MIHQRKQLFIVTWRTIDTRPPRSVLWWQVSITFVLLPSWVYTATFTWMPEVWP